MKTLYRYIIREFFLALVVLLIVFTMLYLIIDFVQKADRFVQHNAEAELVLRYFAFKIPYMVSQVLPVAALIATILVVSSCIKNNEILIIKACGINPFVYLRALLSAAIWLMFMFFIVSEFIVPYTSSRSNDIWKYELEQRKRGGFYGSHQIWYHGKNAIYWIRNFDYEKEIIRDATFYFFDDSFQLVKKINASEGKYGGDHWMLRDVSVQELNEDANYALTRHNDLPLFIPESPESFVREIRGLEELNVLETMRRAKQVKQEGYDNTRYLINMNIRISFYFVILIMVVVGYCVPMIQKKASIPISVSIGLGMCVLYILVFSFSRSIGLSGKIPPFLAAWLSNGAFIFAGIYMLSLVRR